MFVRDTCLLTAPATHQAIKLATQRTRLRKTSVTSQLCAPTLSPVPPHSECDPVVGFCEYGDETSRSINGVTTGLRRKGELRSESM